MKIESINKIILAFSFNITYKSELVTCIFIIDLFMIIKNFVSLSPNILIDRIRFIGLRVQHQRKRILR